MSVIRSRSECGRTKKASHTKREEAEAGARAGRIAECVFTLGMRAVEGSAGGKRLDANTSSEKTRNKRKGRKANGRRNRDEEKLRQFFMELTPTHTLSISPNYVRCC